MLQLKTVSTNLPRTPSPLHRFRRDAGFGIGWLGRWACCGLIVTLAFGAHARVVINEILYNAPDDLEDLEYVELHNSGADAVDLSGWTLSKGIKFQFGVGARIEANAYLVLCRNRDRFKEYYDVPVLGVFNQPLSNKGERLQLADASGRVIDTVKFEDGPPWPMGADGASGSLERICPMASGDDPSNWTSSPLSPDRVKPAGTPGRINAGYSAQFPPVISKLTCSPENPPPQQPISVEVEVRSAEGVGEVKLLFRVVGPSSEGTESAVPMKAISEHRYAAIIPGQAADRLIRFRVQALGKNGARRFFPAETEPRRAFSSYVHEPIQPSTIPFGWIIHPGQPAGGNPEGFGFGRGPGGFNPEEMFRAQIRMMAEAGLDLAGAWFELTLAQPAEIATLQKLRPVFVAKLSERDKVIDDLSESANVEQKLRTLPDVMKSFQRGLADAVTPLLTADQARNFSQWIEKQPAGGMRPGMMMPGIPGTMVRNFFPIEGAWYSVTAQAEPDEAGFARLQKEFQALLKDRNELAGQAASIMGEEGGVQKLTTRIQALDEKLVTQIKPALNPAQEKLFEDWRSTRPAFGGGGRREGPGGFGGGPTQFGPGPGGPRGFGGGPGGFRRGRGGSQASAGAGSHAAAFVYFDPKTGKLEVFDFVDVAPRSGGQKIRFLKDQPLHRMTSVNLIFENETAVLVEPLAYEVYRRAGMAASQSYHVRLWRNGAPSGYHLLVEQPNRAFLKQNKIPDDGNLYKLLWYEQGVAGQHEKKTHPRDGHGDVVALVKALETNQGGALWEVIQKNFDVNQVATYFAVNTVLSHWDGFFNNYFTYHDVKGSGKWTMYPWDQDQTWGVVGMMGRGQVFYDMPITFGMAGDAPPGQRAAPGRGGPRFGFGFGGGGAPWWREPGWFSGPLLANPQFRKLFLARTKEILETVYTAEVFGPIIDAMGERLKPEARVRAEVFRSNPDRAVQNLERGLQSLREHLQKRREFLLAQDEIKNAELPSQIRSPAAAPAP